MASSDSVRGLRWEAAAAAAGGGGDGDDRRGKLAEGSGQPWRCEQGLVLQWLSLSEVRLASDDGGQRRALPQLRGLRGGRWGEQGLWAERREA